MATTSTGPKKPQNRATKSTPLLKAIELPTNFPIPPHITAVSSADIRLPLELWREVIREAGAIQDGFECPHIDVSTCRLFLSRWDKTFQTRLSLALVSRSWYPLALQYLYSFLVFRRETSIMPTVKWLAGSSLARWVQRVTLCPTIDPWGLQGVLEYLPSLRYLRFSSVQSRISAIFDSSFLCRHLTSLDNINLTTEVADSLSQLPNLQRLRCSVDLWQNADHPAIFSCLHTLHMGTSTLRPVARFPVMPKLRTLHITDYIGPEVWDALAAYIPAIHTFSSYSEFLTRFLEKPNGPLSAPHLREVVIQDPSSKISSYISFSRVEIIHLMLDRDVLLDTQGRILFGNERLAIDNLLKFLQVIRNLLSIVPKLHTICTDLTSNTLVLAGSHIRKCIEAWSKALEARNIQVFTRIYETISDDGQQVPLARVLNDAPNFEFWPPCLSDDWDNRRWGALANETGRKSMRWRAKNCGAECEWIDTL